LCRTHPGWNARSNWSASNENPRGWPDPAAIVEQVDGRYLPSFANSLASLNCEHFSAAGPAADIDPIAIEAKLSGEGGVVVVRPDTPPTDHAVSAIWIGGRCSSRVAVFVDHDVGARAFVDVATRHVHGQPSSLLP